MRLANFNYRLHANKKGFSMNFIATLKSVAAAFFGVQSDKNRNRDFSQGKASHFIIAGIIGVIVFIALLIFAVSLVLPSS